MHKSIYQPGDDIGNTPTKSPAHEPILQAQRGGIALSHPAEWAAYRKTHEATFADPILYDSKDDAAKDRLIASEEAYRKLVAIRGSAAVEASCRAAGWMDSFSGAEALAAQVFCQQGNITGATPLAIAKDAVLFHAERAEFFVAPTQSEPEKWQQRVIDEHLRWADIFGVAATAHGEGA